MWVPWNFMTTCVQVCPGKAMLWFLRLPCIQIQPSGKQPTNSNSLSRLSPNSELPPWDQALHTTAGENPRKGWNCLQFELRRGIRCTHHWDTGQCQKEFKSGHSTPKTKDSYNSAKTRTKTCENIPIPAHTPVAIPPRAIPKFEKQLHWKTTIANGGNELTPTRCQEVGDRGSLIDHSQDMQKMCHFARYLSFFNIGPCANILSRDYGMPRQRWCFQNENDCVERIWCMRSWGIWQPTSLRWNWR